MTQEDVHHPLDDPFEQPLKTPPSSTPLFDALTGVRRAIDCVDEATVALEEAGGKGEYPDEMMALSVIRRRLVITENALASKGDRR